MNDLLARQVRRQSATTMPPTLRHDLVRHRLGLGDVFHRRLRDALVQQILEQQLLIGVDLLRRPAIVTTQQRLQLMLQTGDLANVAVLLFEKLLALRAKQFGLR